MENTSAPYETVIFMEDIIYSAIVSNFDLIEHPIQRCVCVYVCVCMCVCVCVCVYMCLCVCVCECVYMYMWVYYFISGDCAIMTCFWCSPYWLEVEEKLSSLQPPHPLPGRPVREPLSVDHELIPSKIFSCQSEEFERVDKDESVERLIECSESKIVSEPCTHKCTEGNSDDDKDQVGVTIVQEDQVGGTIVQEDQVGVTIVQEDQVGGTIVQEDQVGVTIVQEDQVGGTIVQEDQVGGTIVQEDQVAIGGTPIGVGGDDLSDPLAVSRENSLSFGQTLLH